MASITTNHDPNDTVWVILPDTSGCESRVAHGTVIRVRVEFLITLTKLIYDVRLDGSSGTVEVIGEVDIFAEADLALAMAEYQNRISS